MMTTRLLLALLLLITFSRQSFSQGYCASDEINKRQLEAEPEAKSKMEAFETLWQHYNNRGKMDVIGSDTTYEIPVVIHVIHTGGAIGTNYNPADTTLANWITYLNAVFSATYAGYPSASTGGTNIPIRFALAKRDSNCNATTGIVRVNGSGIAGYSTNGLNVSNSTGAVESSIRGLSRWPSNSYYNIYVVNKLDGEDGYTTTSSFTTGYAYFPFFSNDGAYMLAYVARSGQSTLPHEMGHAMGLYHTFEGGSASSCPPNSNCLTDGDKVCDTEPSKNLLLVSPCPTNSTTNACTGSNYNFVQNNIMGYGSCLNRFTAGQRNRALLQLLALRSNQSSSVASVAPAVIAASGCAPTVANAANTFNMGPCNVWLRTLSYTSNGYNQDGFKAYIDNSCYLQTVIQPSVADTLRVTTQSNPQKVRAYIDYNNNGLFETGEIILDHTGTTASETHSAIFTPPGSAVLNSVLRMRVISDFASSATPASCGILDYGQAEDFGVIISSANLLPVRFMHTDAQVMPAEQAIRVTWRIVLEMDINHFSIERSRDGRIFTEAGTQVPASKQASYSFTDHDIIPVGSYYYRIRSQDLDGHVTYSPVVTASFSQNTNNVRIYPNPLGNEKLTYELDKVFPTAVLNITTPGGKSIYTKPINESKGSLDLSELQNGFYLLEVTAPGQPALVKKFVLHK